MRDLVFEDLSSLCLSVYLKESGQGDSSCERASTCGKPPSLLSTSGGALVILIITMPTQYAPIKTLWCDPYLKNEKQNGSRKNVLWVGHLPYTCPTWSDH